MKISLEGRTAFVTGAGRNIGKAIALSLAGAGASVAIAYRSNEAEAAEAAEEASKLGAKAVMVRIDLENVASIREAAAVAARALGPVDILVNNAAMRPRTKIADITVEEWDAVMATNLRGPFFLSQAFIPGMKQKGWGRIVNVSGVDAYWGNPQRAHNVAAKAGIIGLSRTLANETGRWGITVNTLVPGAINTRRKAEWYPNLDQIMQARIERVPTAKIGQPSDLATACTFLVSNEANYITGQELWVTGGGYPMVRQIEVEYD